MQPALIEVRALTKTFAGAQRALDGVDLRVGHGEMVALIGASGSGKSTLLRHIAGFLQGDAVDSEILVDGECVQRNGRLSSDVRRIRSHVGFVFQQFNLVGRLSVMSNVLVGALARTPLWRTLTGRFAAADRELAAQGLAQVGILEQAWKRASDLSGGQQQRVAIARAIVQRAKVILADEPIASLDPESARVVMEMLAHVNRANGIGVVVSLHQVEFAQRYCPRTVALRAGRVVFDGPSNQLTRQVLCDLYGSDAFELFAAPPAQLLPASLSLVDGNTDRLNTPAIAAMAAVAVAS